MTASNGTRDTEAEEVGSVLRRRGRAGAAAAATAAVLLAAGGAAGPASGDAASPGQARGVVAVIDVAHPLGPVPHLAVGGFNFANFMRVVGFERDFADLALRSIRFPAGNLGDERNRTPADLDLLKLHWILLGHPAIVMQARLLGGTPEQAAQAARYAGEIGLPIRYWEIGNEPDLYPPAGSWTPERYCEAFRTFVEALRPVAGEARFAGPAVSGGEQKMKWLREFIGACGDVVDVVTWHVYPTDGTWSDEAALATAARVSEEIDQVRRWIGDPAVNPRGWQRAGEVGLGITEYGLSWRTASFRHLADLTAALWAADVAGRIAAGRLELAHYFALQDTGGHGLIDTAGFRRPTYPVFRMLREYGGMTLPVRLEPAPPGLSAYAAAQDGVLRVLLVNMEPDHGALVRIEADTGQLLTLRRVERLTQASFDAAEDAERLDVPPTAPLGAAGHPELEVPARSVVVAEMVLLPGAP